MAENAWTLLCRRAVIDRETLIPFVIEVVQVISVSEEDIAQEHGGYIEFPMQLYGLWARSDWSVPEEITLRLRILLPTGEYSEVRSEANEESFSVSLLEAPTVRPRIKLMGLPWAGLGIYWFLLEEQTNKGKWQLVTRIPLQLRKKESE